MDKKLWNKIFRENSLVKESNLDKQKLQSAVKTLKALNDRIDKIPDDKLDKAWAMIEKKYDKSVARLIDAVFGVGFTLTADDIAKHEEPEDVLDAINDFNNALR